MNITSAVKAVLRKLILPHPAPNYIPSDKTAPVVIAGMFRTANGIGKAAQGCYEALQAEGLAPLAVDTSGLLNQARCETSLPLTQLDPTKPGTLILFANPPEIERCLMALGLRRWHRWRIIGAWAWETPVAPPAWRRQSSFVSEIWAPSRFVAEAFRQAYDKPVHIVPHYVSSKTINFSSPPEIQNEGKFIRILTLADARSSLTRKNPIAAVKMFKMAFPEGDAARLTVKCRNLELFTDYATALKNEVGEDDRITLLNETLSDAAFQSLMDESDILLSPHRSEGFGLPLAEAMAAGKCVVATGWSGNMEFMTTESSFLLPYTLVPIEDKTGIYQSTPHALWAEPEIKAGANALSELHKNAELRRSMGERAQQEISNFLKSAHYSVMIDGNYSK